MVGASGKIAFLFPGQGGLPQDGIPRSRIGERLLDCAEESGLELRELLAEGDLEALSRTEYAQPTIFIDSLSREEILREKGLLPTAASGHSLGEFAALVCAGCLDAEKGLKLVIERGRLMAEVEGGMAAIMRLPPEEVVRLCEEEGQVVTVANLNGPAQVVISGTLAALSAAISAAESLGGRAVGLDVSGPFHSPLMARAESLFAPRIEALVFTKPKIQFVSSVSGRKEEDPLRLRALMLQQMTSCVRWTDVVNSLEQGGVDCAVETGSAGVLIGLGRRITPGIRFLGYEEAAGG